MILARIQAWDLQKVRQISALPLLKSHPKALKFLTRIGDGWIWGIVCGLMFSFYSQAEIIALLSVGLSAGLISLGLYEGIKLSTKRPRPFILAPELSPEVPPMDRYSFPSGHVMNNFAVGLALALLSPALGIPLMVLALVWGLLRIHFCVHYPTDILVGLVLALPCASLALVAQKHLLPWIHHFGI